MALFSPCLQDVYKSKNYIAMHYKKGNNIGIRRKKTKGDEKSPKQIFTFGSGLGWKKAKLMTWAGKVLKKLDEGKSEKAAADWIHDELGNHKF